MDISGFSYSVRIDTYENTPVDLFSKFKKFSGLILNYIVADEVSEKGKRHLQCIIWFSKILEQITISKYRNWLKQFSAKTKQSVSFTKSIKPESLSSYCMKDKNFITNLSPEIVSQIPDWRENLNRKKDEFKKKQKELFYKKCQDYVKFRSDIVIDPDDYACYATCMEYLEYFSQIYFKIYESPMRYHTGLSVLFKFKLLSHKKYVNCIYERLFSL